MTGLSRKRVCFTGRVQGVGFRYTTQRVARSHPVTGFVRNLPDGRVELVAEGAPSNVDRFIEDVKSTLEHHIHQCDTHELEGTGEFDEFHIRH